MPAPAGKAKGTGRIVTPAEVAASQFKIAKTAEEFSRQIQWMTKQMPAEGIQLLQKRVAYKALSTILHEHPRDTGRAAGNWQVGINETTEDEVPNATKRSNDSVVKEGQAKVDTTPPYAIVHIMNNVPYIIYLEAGSSDAAPEGMVARAIEVAKKQHALVK